MPDREPTQVVLGNGQLNLNDTTFDVSNATLTINNEYEEAMQRLINNTRAATTATTDFHRLVEQFAETPLTNVITAQDAHIGIDLARHQDGYMAMAQAYELHIPPWTEYNPFFPTDGYVTISIPSEEDEEPELDEKNDKLDGFLGEFIKEAV